MREILIWGLAVLFGSWGLVLIWLGWMDASARKRDREMLEVRRWQETVQAMRRMADREGDA